MDESLIPRFMKCERHRFLMSIRLINIISAIKSALYGTFNEKILNSGKVPCTFDGIFTILKNISNGSTFGEMNRVALEGGAYELSDVVR